MSALRISAHLLIFTIKYIQNIIDCQMHKKLIILSMFSQKYSPLRKQRFKIEVVKKNSKRVMSVPKKLSCNPSSQHSLNEEEHDSKTNTKYKQNNNQEGNHEKIQSFRTSAHLKSKSQLWTGGPFQTCGAEDLAFDSIVINSISYKNIFKGYNTNQQSENARLGQFLNKKLSEPRTLPKPTKSSQNKVFKDLNLVKCQSITLLQVPRKHHQPVHKNPQPRCTLVEYKKQSWQSHRIIKIPSAQECPSSCPNKTITYPGSNGKINFHLQFDAEGMYLRKLKIYFDFLFKVNFSNRIFLNFQLKERENDKFKVYVAWGNNHHLIKTLIRNRFWLQLADSPDDPHIRLFWTPWPSRDIYNKQKDRQHSYPAQHHIKKRPKKQQPPEHNNKLFLENPSEVQAYILGDGFIMPFRQSSPPQIMSNHLSNTSAIAQKNKLFHSIFKYYVTTLKMDPFSVIPLTYNVGGLHDPEFHRFLRDNQAKLDKIWIVKPGENTNRGEGIYLAKTSDVHQFIQSGIRQTFVIQSYIDRPLLYNGRKFDVRHFLLLTSVNGILKAYWFKEGYVRTSSQVFTLDDLTNNYIHLTNDAIQQRSSSYGSYEPGNKISYSELQRYLDSIFPKKNINFEEDILAKMEEIICNVVKANINVLDSRKKEANFELLGIDFMIDRDLKPWLIEINENPCLETGCQLLSRLIPSVIENTLRLCIDPLLPPPTHFPMKLQSSLNDHYLKSLKYKIIFDQWQYERQNSSK